jgi:hypothetical protein
VDSQDHLRLACDAISAEIADDIVAFYMAEKDKQTKAVETFCPSK